MRGMLDRMLRSACRSPVRYSCAWSGVLKIAVPTSPVNSALDRTDPMGFLNGVIVTVPFG
jgi:hypothetical protein